MNLEEDTPLWRQQQCHLGYCDPGSQPGLLTMYEHAIMVFEVSVNSPFCDEAVIMPPPCAELLVSQLADVNALDRWGNTVEQGQPN